MTIETSPLYQAVDRGDSVVVHKLADDAEGTMTQKQKDDFLAYCLSQRRPEAAHAALLAGADPDLLQGDTSRPALSGVIAATQMEEAVLLVVMGADVNLVDSNGDTPAHFAARADAPAILELLHRNGANLSLVNALGKTPEDVARENQNNNALSYLSELAPATPVPRRHRVSM